MSTNSGGSHLESSYPVMQQIAANNRAQASAKPPEQNSWSEQVDLENPISGEKVSGL